MFTSESLSIGAFTHSVVKGLSRGKFAAVNFYSGTLPRCFAVIGTHFTFTTVDFRFHAIIFPGNA